MARKPNDVELIITAKNESERAFQDVTSALKEIEAAAKKGGGLSDLFKGFNERLAEAAAGQKAFNKLIGDTKDVQKAIDKASKFTAAVQAQEKALAGATGRVAELEASYADMEKAATAARAPSEKLVKSLAEQEARQKSLAAAIDETRRQRDLSNASLGANGGADDRATAAIAKQRSVVLDAGNAWRSTTQAIADAKKQLGSLATSRDSIQAALTTSTSSRSGLEAELRTLKEFIREAQKLSRTDGIGGATKSLLGGAKQRVAEVESLLKSERQTQAALTNDLSKTEAAIRRQESSIDKLTNKARTQKSAYDDLRNSLKQFEAAAKSEGAARQQKDIDVLNTKLERLQKNYDDTTQKVNATNAAIAKSAEPDPRAVAQFESLKNKIDEARAAVVREQVELDKLNKELRDAGISTDELARRQKELDAVTERLTAEEARLTAELQRMESAAGRAGTSVRQTGRNFLQLGDDTRQSLSYLQRIRGELLSIAATYTGVFAVGGAIRSIYDASVQLNKAQARFSVFFDGDAQKVADEIAFVTKTSKDLKIEIESTLDVYSKFVSGLDQSQVPLDQIRKTFVGFSTAARVGRLSSEELERVFTALTQIFGKQQLQTEELKGQLADALPGAVKRTADALGLGADGVKILTKEMEEGNVRAEAAILLADELYKVYSVGLPGALNSADAALADFNNALFEIRTEIGKSGFIEELTKALKEVTKEISSPQFKEGAKAFASGLAQIVKFAVEAVKNIELLAKVAGLIFGAKLIGSIGSWVSSIYSAGRALEQMGDAATATNKSMGVLTKGVGLLLRALALLPAAFAAGFAFGTYLRNEFPAVEKFGVVLVSVFEKLKIQVSAVWKKMVADFSGFLKQMLVDIVNFTVDLGKLLGSRVTRFLPDDFEKRVDNLFEKLKLDDVDSAKLKLIDDDTRAQIAAVDDQITQMFIDIDKNRKGVLDVEQTKKDANAITQQLDRLFTDAERAALRETAVTGGGEKAAKELEKLRTKVTKALAEIDTEIQAKSGDTLEIRLDAIRGKYAQLLNDIQKAGGSAAFPNAASSVNQIVAIKQVQETEKEINELIQERRTLISGINEQAELGAITVEEATTRINEQNARLIPQMQAALDKAREIASAINSAPVTQSVNAQAEAVALEAQRSKKEQLLALENEINRVMELRSARIQTVNDQVEIGLLTETEGRRQVLDLNRQTKQELDLIIQNAMKMAEAMGDKELVERLKQVNIELARVNEQIITAAQFNEQFASGLTDAIDGFVAGTQSASDALRQFFADMLRWLARAIIQWTILKAIQNSGFGGVVAGGVNAGVNHTGGVVGKTASRKRVPVTAFAGAVRYHSGGIAGLKPNEVPTILERGEEVLTENDPRHRNNGGGTSGSSPMQVKIVNTIDSASVLNEALNSQIGQKTLVNAIRANKSSIKSVLT